MAEWGSTEATAEENGWGNGGDEDAGGDSGKGDSGKMP